MPRIPQNSGPALPGSQQGAALMVVLVLVGLLISMFAVVFVNDVVRQNLKQKRTAEALAQAKEALIGFAVSGDLGTGNYRPGDLPCPDINDDGEGTGSCSDTGETAIGRLPWKTLGLTDIRDGDGERLWYAVSENFINNPRTTCASPSEAGCLNSNTRGTITLGNKNNQKTNRGSTASGVIAVVMAPGAVLTREGAGSPQNRTCAGGSCSAAGVCTTTPHYNTPKCNPANYLDIWQGEEDNANFRDSDDDNGFINGPVYDGNNLLIVNDEVLPITYEDLMPLLERRVAREAMSCLNAYARESFDRFPWAASVAGSSTGTGYSGEMLYRFGRLPDDFGASLLGLVPDTTPALGPVVTTVCTLAPALCVKTAWPATSGPLACKIPAGGGGWWMNWKDEVFYGFAPDYVPSSPLTASPLTGPLVTFLNSLLGGILENTLPGLFTPPTTPGPCGAPGTCLAVNPPSATTGRKVVVAVAGRSLAGQQRSAQADREMISNYLENANGANLGGPIPPNFTVQPSSATFNDFLLYQ